MKKTCTNLFVTLALLFFVLGTKAQNNFFTDAGESSFKSSQPRVIVPEKYRTISLDTLSLANFLKNVPLGKDIKNRNSAPVLTIPLPNGKSGRFHIWETPIMEPALAAKFPTIKTYTGQGIDEPAATIKIDWTEAGFDAMVLSSKTSTVFIDPYTQHTKTNYISYYRSDFKNPGEISEPILPENNSKVAPQSRPAGIQAGLNVGTQLLTYRLVIASTHQYADSATGLSSPTVSQTLTAIVKTVTRVNGIYEKELSVSLVLIANEDAVIFNDPNNDPLKSYNDNPGTLITQGQAEITSLIGDANYDVGETFSTGAGGLSEIGVVCQPGIKANSTVGIQHPVGDPFDVDYVCHEIGHEFGAHHPFNSDMGFCAAQGQQDSSTNDEPGSGSTIVGYSSNLTYDGIILCGSDNLQPDSDPYFNTVNFDEIINFVTSGSGSECPVITPTVNADHTSVNHPPTVNALSNYTIPLLTSFVLTGSATDIDGDSLTYCWEEFDVGNNFGAWNTPVRNAPIFRSFLPDSVPYRYFPKLSDVINNTTTIGEIMPSYARTLHFRLTARDNQPNGGGVSYSGNAVTVDGTSGPFVVTYPDTTNIVWNVGNFETVTWNPANTQNSPVSCNKVTIQLSIDGGLTYPITLVDSTANTGSAQIKVPEAITTTARIRVMAVGNIFYDISDNDFTIQDTTVPIIWISFTGTPQNNNTALLTWVVDELNVDHYEVEHSVDDITFDTIATVKSITGNGVQQQYSDVNQNPFQGTNYYRIEEVNKSGSFTYSDIITVSFNSIPAVWTIFPNPAIGSVNVVSNTSSSNVALQLFDAEGRLVYENELSQTTVGQLINIALEKFAKGIYTLKINSSTGVTQQKIVVE
jgi:hypothetical protein